MSTSQLPLTISILCFLLSVSSSAMASHIPDRPTDKLFQIPIDTPAVAISQNSKYLMPGQEIEITVMTCQNKDRITSIAVGHIAILPDENGTAVFKLMGGSLGIHKVDVEITFLDSNDKPHTKTYPVEYEVGQANVNIDESNLNFLYIGVDNPLNIYASGGVSNQITVSIKGSSASLTKAGPGKYIARANTVSDSCIIYVYVDGKMAGAKRFRVVHLPAPEVTIGNFKPGSQVSAAEFGQQHGIKVAAMKDFPFKVNYRVTGYTVKILAESSPAKSFTSSDSQFPSDLKTYISQLKPGSAIVIDDITVEEPAARKIKLPAIVYFIN